jgi:hypothetical protein
MQLAAIFIFLVNVLQITMESGKGSQAVLPFRMEF